MIAQGHERKKAKQCNCPSLWLTLLWTAIWAEGDLGSEEPFSSTNRDGTGQRHRAGTQVNWKLQRWTAFTHHRFLYCHVASVDGAIREGEVGQQVHGGEGSLLEVRDLPLANFRQHRNPYGKSHPRQCSCIFMNPHTYALLKSGHLTHPHFVFIETTAAQDQHGKLQNGQCAVITTWANVFLPFSQSIDPRGRNICASLSSLPALPATFLLSHPPSDPAHRPFHSSEAMLWNKE